jgi:LPXTG-site transpeptidase (sortase) family protein
LFVAGLYLIALFTVPELSWRFGDKSGLHPEPVAAAAPTPGQDPVSGPTGEPAAATPRYDIGNTVVIEKIGVRLDIVEAENAAALEKGAWHRRPEQGNPEIGGNFILTGHRFGFDWTPQGVARNSAFYHLDKLTAGDVVTVYWNGRRYDYTIDTKKRIDPDDGWVENQTADHILTLYTCTLGGEYDGRIVYTAKPRET